MGTPERLRRALAFWARLGCAGLLLAVCPEAMAAGSSSAPPRGVSQIVSSVFPGAAIKLGSDGTALGISVPPSLARLPGAGSPRLVAPAAPDGEGRDVIAGELGWKAAVVAGLAGVRDRKIVYYQLTERRHRFTSFETGYLSGQLRAYPGASEYGGFPNIGAVPLRILSKQLRSNVRVLKRALPGGTVLGSEQLVIPVDGRADDYAFEVDLKVANLASLRRYQGDMVCGLSTGLVGGPTATSEGLAINVVDSRGRRASWWSAERAETGMGISDHVLGSPGGAETVKFPDITGGPAATGFASGGGGGSA